MVGQVAAEVPHSGGHEAGPEYVILRVGPNQQGQSKLREIFQQAIPPQRRAFRPRWRVTSTDRPARIA